MPLDTTTQVEQLRVFTDNDGARVPSAQTTGNLPKLEGITHTTSGTTAEALPQRDIPHGSTVMVTPDTNNSDTVFVGPSGAVGFPLASGGDTFTAGVLGLSQIEIQTPTAGDSVYVMWEDL